MNREIKLTADGSHTIAIPGMNLTYHSHHGAIAESRHVYIEAGLLTLINASTPNPLNILEIGFGTGLNALLSLQEAIKQKQHIHYTAIELFPLTQTEIAQINHGKCLLMENDFLQIHSSPWEKDILLHEFFTLQKRNISLLELKDLHSINCIYFDAFAPTDQPELWTQAVFENLYQMLSPQGILVTYSSKTVIRRAMEAAGFSIQKIPGPHGKRDMVRAKKIERG
ncbi:MAG: tRNA (5-methylaminomethyl-2-thiouridine)(34)-methyltransferase MnmD [Bacteroidota bacterium]